MTTTIFDDVWHAEIIERYSPDRDDENGNAARAILAGLCVLAQSINRVADAIRSGDENCLVDAVRDVAESVGSLKCVPNIEGE